MSEQVVVYDLLEDIDEDGMHYVADLFAMAGQLGKMARGYFFEKRSVEVLNALEVSAELLDRLWSIRGMLLEELRGRGMDASEEYALMGEVFGGTRISGEEAVKIISQHLPSK